MSGIYFAASGFVAGALGAQIIGTIENPVSNPNPITLIEPTINGIPGAVNVSAFLYQLARTSGSLPSGGTTLAIEKQNTSEVTASAIIRTSPTATLGSANLWTNCPGVVLSSLGTFVPNPVPDIIVEPENYAVVINPGEAIAISTSGGSIGWNHWYSFLWTET